MNFALQIKKTITHNKISLTFLTPNRLNKFRVNSFSSKEPETLEWIDGFKKEAVFWDIGANIGLYSCYAAKSKKCKVFAFEPSVFNLELLARNISLNGLSSHVTLVPFPLSDSIEINTFNMTSIDWGGALSTFGKVYGWDGKPFKPIFDYQMVSLTADAAVALLRLTQPNYIKIDVDGIEHLVLGGARNLLSRVDSLLIEINDDFQEQVEICERLLKDAGLFLKEKKHSDSFNDSTSFGGGKVWNQIWTRR